HPPPPRPARRRKRWGDGRNRRPLRSLAGAKRALVGAVDELDLDLGRFRHGEDRIGEPIARLDAVTIELYLLVQRPAGRLDDAAFDLICEAVPIDDEAG